MTVVNVKFTGHIRSRIGIDQLDFVVDGSTLGDVLEALFNEYKIQDLILDDDGNILPYSRVVVNGRFSYLVGDMDAPIEDGDSIVLIRPYVVAF